MDCKGKLLDMTYVRRFQRVRVTFSGESPGWIVGNRERMLERWRGGELPPDGSGVSSVQLNMSELVGDVFADGTTLGEVMEWLSDYRHDSRKPGK